MLRTSAVGSLAADIGVILVYVPVDIRLYYNVYNDKSLSCIIVDSPVFHAASDAVIIDFVNSVGKETEASLAGVR